MAASKGQGGLGYLLIGQPALASIVARALATKGAQPQDIEQRYQLGLNALDLTDYEYRYLRRTTTFQAHATQAAVAAQNQAVTLSIGSVGTARSVVAVLEELTICNDNAGAQTFFYGVSNVNSFGATGGPFFGMAQDDRSLGTDAAASVQSAAFVQTQSNAGAFLTANRAGRIVLAPGTSQILRGPWVLSGRTIPSLSVFSSFVVLGGQSNIIVTAGMRWYERDLLASEL